MTKQVQIVLVVGESGVGKSAVGKQIAKKLKYTYIDKDTVTGSLSELYLSECSPTKDPHDRDSEFYHQKVRPVEYETLLNIVHENVQLGIDMVITAHFTKELQEPDWLQNSIMKRIMAVAQLNVISVHVDPKTMLARLISRNELKDTWKLQNWDQYIKSVAHLQISWDKESYRHYTFDNSESLPILHEIKVNNLIEWLKK